MATDRTTLERNTSARPHTTLRLLSKPLATVGRLARAVGDILVPPMCLSCQTPIRTHTSLCPSCWTSIQFITPPVCDVLGIPLPFDPGGETVSATALADPPRFDRARAAVLYTGAPRRLIHALKFNDQHGPLPLLARWMQTAGTPLFPQAHVLMPVPLSRRRLWSRRFNQSALLATQLSALTGTPTLLDALARVRHTRSQIGLTDLQRQKNVSGAFRMTKRYKASLAGKRVILVDDVITTGATVNACARVLKTGGVGQVDVLTVARVLPDHVREAVDLI